MPTVAETETLTITILYDNNAYDSRLQTDWGFSALVDFQGERLLFDTGGKATILLENMEILGVDPAEIELVALSHAHGDHVGGLEGLLDKSEALTIYLPPSFSSGYKRRLSQTERVVEVEPGQRLAPGMFSTGEIRVGVPEQALVIESPRGLVLVTGCAHPGVVHVVEQARHLRRVPLHLVMGGFHLGSKNTQELEKILASFRDLEIQRVAPCHCTGDKAIAMFRQAYGEDFLQAGVGRVIVVGP